MDRLLPPQSVLPRRGAAWRSGGALYKCAHRASRRQFQRRNKKLSNRTDKKRRWKRTLIKDGCQGNKIPPPSRKFLCQRLAILNRIPIVANGDSAILIRYSRLLPEYNRTKEKVSGYCWFIGHRILKSTFIERA